MMQRMDMSGNRDSERQRRTRPLIYPPFVAGRPSLLPDLEHIDSPIVHPSPPLCNMASWMPRRSVQANACRELQVSAGQGRAGRAVSGPHTGPPPG